MPTYRYETKNSSGKITSGILTAATLAAAAQQLRDRSDYILVLAPMESGMGRKKLILIISFGPSQKDVQTFTSQLAVMIRAGISIRAAIEGIADQTVNVKFKAMLTQ